MNRIEHYHDWLRDAHAMEKQAEKMLESMASRIENYPELRSRIEQHISETKNQLSQLESILDRNNISRSVIKDSMSKMAAFGQSIGGIFPSDEIVKGSISGYVFEQFEIACYTSIPTRERSFARSVFLSLTTIPSTVISPCCTGSRPLTVLISVDFPEPDGPQTTTTSPFFTSVEQSVST